MSHTLLSRKGFLCLTSALLALDGTKSPMQYSQIFQGKNDELFLQIQDVYTEIEFEFDL